MPHKLAAVFGVTAVVFFLQHPGVVWGQFQFLGGAVVGNPGCATADDGSGHVICAVQGTDHALYGIRFDPWTRFTTGFQRLIQNVDLGPQGEPSCATADDGRGQVLCGIRGLGDQPSSFMIESIPSTRTQRPDGFQVLGGAIIDDPGCATADDGSGHVICAFKNEDNRLFAFRFYTPTLFTTAVQVLGGFAVGNPSCASTGDGSGQATCAVQGRDHALYGIRFEPWDRFTTGFQRLGGIVTSDPSCATADDERGQVICAVRGADNALYGIAIRP